MIVSVVKKFFNIREGELKISVFMLTYIFLIISTLLIVKPTVNALFLSEIGIESLPFAYLLVAIVAILSSYFYSKFVQRFSLNKVIESTLVFSIVLLIGLGLVLKFSVINAYLLYFFYVWVAIYAVLSASQFWMLANLVFNIREAKRLFGFIGAGAIAGGIFGGYLASLLAPIIGIEYLVFIAALFLVVCIPLLKKIWKHRVSAQNSFMKNKRVPLKSDHPFTLIKKSKHLGYIAKIVAISVIVAKLVDYLFSDFASSAIADPDELTSFFAFWFSTFNLISLVVQLFLTHRIVGIWGVGLSLLLLPLGIFGASLVFLAFPELAIIIIIKAVDGTLKQSVNKSAIELLSLPLPFDLKNRTKSFIDVVIDSIATGIAGFILIFVIRGLDLKAEYISLIIVALVGLWIYFIVQVRIEYFKTFRRNIKLITDAEETPKKPKQGRASVMNDMKAIFKNGNEQQIVVALNKLQEINDKRLENEVRALLSHPSDAVKAAAVQNLYFFNNNTIVTEVSQLLQSKDDDVLVATLEYLLLHANANSDFVFDRYLDHSNPNISDAALYCLAKEARRNQALKVKYQLEKRIDKQIDALKMSTDDTFSLLMLLRTIGVANLKAFHPFLFQHLHHSNRDIQLEAIAAAGVSVSKDALPQLLPLLAEKELRPVTRDALIYFGPSLVPYLADLLKNRTKTLAYHRHLPMVMAQFNSKVAVQYLFPLIKDSDLKLRLQVIRVLNQLKGKSPGLRLNKFKVVAIILDECKLYLQTMAAMHTQIIISYRNRKKSKELISSEERKARSELLDLLELRLDDGLERIFKLLGLRYSQTDVEVAYTGLMSEKQEAQANAIEYLDSLLTGDLKLKLLPIIENTVMDVTSEDVIQRLQQKIPTEFECFQLLLNTNDLKIRLAVLDLILHQNEKRYVNLVEDLNANARISTKEKQLISEITGRLNV